MLPAYAAAEGAWGAWIPAQHPSLRWEGRVRFDDAKAAHYDWSSVKVHADFEGSTLAVYARLGENHLDLSIDGQPFAVLGPSPKVDDTAWASLAVPSVDVGGAPVFVVKGMAPGRHRLTLSKRTSPNFGVVSLQGLRFNAAAQLHSAPPARKRRLEFIGDSLTNAYGVEAPGKECKALAPYENSSLSWARLSAEALEAEAHLLAVSGAGLDQALASNYVRVLLGEVGVWDRAQFVPDLAVVFLGSHDYRTPPYPKSKKFEEAYEAFLDQVREGRPQLKILLAYPDDKGALATRVRSVIDGQQMVGHWVEGLALPNAADAELGCDGYPQAAVHARWSELAVAKIRKVMEW